MGKSWMFLRLRPFPLAPTLALNLSVIGGRRDLSATSRPVRMKELAPRLVDPFVSVRPKEVPLGLQQIRRQPLASIAVIEGQRR
jgi:hypothetical protein